MTKPLESTLMSHSPLRRRSAGRPGSGHSHPDVLIACSRKLVAERLLARDGEMHHVVALADLAAKALTEKIGDIGFVVHDKYAGAHAAAPVPVCESRGSRIVNSVNSPTRLSTSIVPPCC